MNNVFYKIITIFAVIFEITATKHWYVTENGRIQPQHDSVFDMRRPYDLLAFLEQEKRRETANAIYKKISRKEVSIDNQFVSLGIADTEDSNSDCFLWDKSLAEINVYTSIVIDYRLREGINQNDYMLYNVVANSKQTVPDCQNTFPLDFSIYTFEHLKAMQNRKNLTQYTELDLMKYLPLSTDLNEFGHQLAYSLSRNKTSWVYLNLASIYWRIKGNAYNALECSRRAIVCAPSIEDEIESLDDDIPTVQPIYDKGNSEINHVTEMMRFSLSLQDKSELDMARVIDDDNSGTQSDTLQGLGTKIALELQKHCASWILAIAASFYWRAVGDSRKALDCMEQSLENTPKDMQDIFLVNLASFLNSQNYFYEALEVTQIALSIGPDFIINHYILVNLYAALGDFETAANFYKSSLELDPNFKPVITRLRVILCFLLFEDKRSVMDEILRNIL